MKLSLAGAAAVKQRMRVREEFWRSDIAWEGPDEIGYFCGPRSLPLVIQALGRKEVSGSKDPGAVYLELLSRHMGQGVVDMTHEEEHAFAAGYASTKSWRERMKVLESAGFIKPFAGGRRYAKVFLVHPTLAMRALYEAGKIPKHLWDVYRSRQIDAREPSAEELIDKRQPKSVVTEMQQSS